MAVCEIPIFCSILFIVVVIVSVTSVDMVTARRARSRSDECAVFKATQSETYNSARPTYIALGEIDVSDGFSVSMEILAHPLSHNGVLFAASSIPEFKLTWTYGQYVVLEFIHSSLTLTVKSTTSQHLKMIEISRATPVVYNINDLQWHSVKATRSSGRWTLTLDDSAESERVDSQTDVQLDDNQAFIGGRPGYYQNQFSGVVRRVRVNDEAINLRDLTTHENVDVVRCSSSQVEEFIAVMEQQQDYFYNYGHGPLA